MVQGTVEYCRRGFLHAVRDMLGQVDSSKIGCNVGGMCINMLAYADDIVLLAHSWRGLQQLLVIVMQQSGVINMSLNPRKSVCVVFLCAIGLKW